MKDILKFFLFRPKCFLNAGVKSIGFTPTKVSLSTSFQKEILNGCSRKAETLFVRGFWRCFHTTAGCKDKFISDSREKQKAQPKIIYYGELTARIKGLKIFACVSSFGSLVAVPLIMQNVMTESNFTSGVMFCTGIAAFSFFTPILIHAFTKKYVTEIAYNSVTDTYTATTLSFFLSNVNMEFTIEDVKIPSSLPALTTMLIKEKPLFIFSEGFFDNKHYIKMMRYDKPIDLKLKNNNDTSKNRK